MGARTYLEVIQIGPERALARGSNGIIVLDGVAPSDLRDLLKTSMESEAPLGASEEALRRELDPLLAVTAASVPPGRICVLGQGQLGSRIAHALKAVGIHEIASFALCTPPSGDDAIYRTCPRTDVAEGETLSQVEQMFGQFDLIVCCLERAPFATMLAINDLAMKPGLAPCLFVYPTAGALRCGPLTPHECLFCAVLTEVQGAEDQDVADFLKAVPSFTTQALTDLEAWEVLAASAVAEVIKSVGARTAADRAPRPHSDITVVTPRGTTFAPHVQSTICPSCQQRIARDASWGLWVPALQADGKTSWQGAHAKKARAMAELTSRGAGTVVHSWAQGTSVLPRAAPSFQEHLLGTYAILSAWRQDEATCLAGLMHSCYSTEEFARNVGGAPLFSFAERGAVRDLIGKDAEELVFLFCSINRPQFIRDCELSRWWKRPSVQNRYTHEVLELRPEIAARLATIEVANTAEQARDENGGPTLWLSDASRTLSQAKALLPQPPPVFAASSQVIDIEAEKTAMHAYNAAVDGGNTNEALDWAKVASAANPWVGEPSLLAGWICSRVGRTEEAERFVAVGKQRLIEWGTAWDKRASHAEWLGWADTTGRRAT